MSARPAAETITLGPLGVMAVTGQVDTVATDAMVRQRDDFRWHNRFIRALLEADGDFDEAAKKARVSIYSVYSAEERHPAFAAELLQARALIDRRRADRIERETAKRAADGTPYTKFDNKGNVTETGTTPDTAAASLMLKALAPKRFRDPEKAAGDAGVQSVTEMLKALADAARATGANVPPERPLRIQTAAAPSYTPPGGRSAEDLRDLQKIANGEPTGGEPPLPPLIQGTPK